MRDTFTMAYKCALCGQISFKTFNDYSDHRALFHGLKTQSQPAQIKAPIVVSRTRKEIIDAIENSLLKKGLVSAEPLPPPQAPPTLIVVKKEEPKAHDKDCKCQDCLVSKLQSICDSVILNLDILEKVLTLKQ